MLYTYYPWLLTFKENRDIHSSMIMTQLPIEMMSNDGQ